MGSTLLIVHPGVEDPASDPTVEAVRKPAAGASRPLAARVGNVAALRGKRLALLDNSKVNARELFEALAERLRSMGVAEVQRWRKQHAGTDGMPLIREILAWKADLAITGLGD